ncbi:MAG: GHKL domain-containing protein [Eubacteriales bacterium]|nr:GHKL domain-containing protein [Eubacteriales bacterium]
MIDLNIFWHAFQLLVFLGLSMVFLLKVFGGSLSVSKKVFWIRLCVHFILITLIVCITFTEISPYPNKKAGALLILLFTIIFYKTVTQKKIIFLLFVLFVLLNVQMNSFFLANATLRFHHFPEFIAYEYSNLLLAATLYCILIFLVVYLSLSGYYKRIVEENIIMKHTEFLFCLPALFFVTISVLVNSLYESASDIDKELFLPLILLNIFALASYYVTLRSIVDNYDASLEREQLTIAQNQLSLWETQYKGLQNKIDSDARVRHDWRQHIITIMGYVQNKDMTGLEEYLSEYKEKYLLPDTTSVCDILPLNMLFQYYKRKAEETDVRLLITPVRFDKCWIPVTDLAVLFGNLLENALEACGKLPDGPRYIHLRILRTADRISLLCENTYDGTVSRFTDRMMSEKKNGGIGILSIEGIVEKYGGRMKICSEGQIFKLYAFLQDNP